MSNYKIKVIETKKHNIKQNELMKKCIIPKFPSCTILCGASGSGKSNVLANLMTREDMYKGYHDIIFLFSSTPDDMLDMVDIPKERIFTQLDASKLQHILDTAREIIEKDCKKDISIAPKILIIFEDCVADSKFLNSAAFLSVFTQLRPHICQALITTQAYHLIPRKARINATNVMFFKGGVSENERIGLEYCAPGLNKDQMMKMIDVACEERFNFLHINMHAPLEERYRKNLGEIIRW
jgi:hypothetical protein